MMLLTVFPMLYTPVHLYVESKKQNEQNKTERLTETENKLMIARGRGQGAGAVMGKNGKGD